jgi:hypothetical protein
MSPSPRIVALCAKSILPRNNEAVRAAVLRSLIAEQIGDQVSYRCEPTPAERALFRAARSDRRRNGRQFYR